MFIVEAGAAATTLFLVPGLAPKGLFGFQLQIVFWLWATVLFANFAEAVAEGRGKAQADALRRPRRTPSPGGSSETAPRPTRSGFQPRASARATSSSSRRTSMIPGDGTVIEGIASVNESAITGESAPVIREAGGDRSAVTGGTTVLSDRIVVEITSEPGQTFLDRMIRLVEGAERQKTPNEIALDILLAGLTIVFLFATVTLTPLRGLLRGERLRHRSHRPPRLPHPDDDRRPPVGDRHRRDGPGPDAQHPGDVGTRRGGRRRRQRPPPRQDRDDHARKPGGHAASLGPARRGARVGRASPSSRPSPTRLRRGARSSSWRRRSTAFGAATCAS